MKTQPEDEAVGQLEARLFRSMALDEPSPRVRELTAAALGIAAATAAKSAGAGTVVTAVTSMLGATSTQALPIVILKSIAVGAVAGAVAMGGTAYVKKALVPAPAAGNTARPSAAPSAQRPVKGQFRARSSRSLHAPSAASSEPPPHAFGAAAHGGTSEPELGPLAPNALVPAVEPEPRMPRGLAAVPAPPRNEVTPAPTLATSEPDAPARRAEVSPTPALATPKPDAPALRAEVALLDQARGALTRGDATRAREWLQQYRDAFPQGALALESHVLWIELLFLSGDAARASALAREFLSSHATSTHAGRMRYLLSTHEKP